MEELYLELTDAEWPDEGATHTRQVARAIVYDDEGYLYFVRADRDDAFGRSKLIETSGGGVDPGETPDEAIKRELREELGAEVETICKLGVVSDYYNLIHRHNMTHYFLCRAVSFGEKALLDYEINRFHLTTARVRPEEARREYEEDRFCRLGRLIAARELPILDKAVQLIEKSKD